MNASAMKEETALKSEVKEILESVREGTLSVDDALLRLKTEPFDDIGFAKVDLHRRTRQGFPVTAPEKHRNRSSGSSGACRNTARTAS